jgi:hypothetical protein
VARIRGQRTARRAAGAGTHHVEIRKDGYRSYLTDIPFGNGQTRTLNVALTKQ